MNRTRHLARTLQAAALCLAAAACSLATLDAWYAAAGTGSLAVVLDACAHHLLRRARREQAIARRLARLHHPEPTPPAGPCCQFWKHSDGAIHGPGCTRPPATRRLGPLTDEERATFAEITAHYDDQSAA